MAQWLKAVAALAKDLGLVPSTHMVAGNMFNCSSKNPAPSSGLCGSVCT